MARPFLARFLSLGLSASLPADWLVSLGLRTQLLPASGSLQGSAHPARSCCPSLHPPSAVCLLHAHPPPSFWQFHLPSFSFKQVLFWLIMTIIPAHCTAPI